MSGFCEKVEKVPQAHLLARRPGPLVTPGRVDNP
jgi:hypothetical protein